MKVPYPMFHEENMAPQSFSYRLISYFVAAALLTACGSPEENDAPRALGDVAQYREWPLRREVTASAAGHGGTATVYANTVVANYLAKAAPAGATDVTLRYPEGSIIVKDVFGADGALQYVAIMRKADEPPAGAEVLAGWVWSQRTAPASVDAWRTREQCLDCHARANDVTFHDGVFVFPDCTGDIVCD